MKRRKNSNNKGDNRNHMLAIIQQPHSYINIIIQKTTISTTTLVPATTIRTKSSNLL